MRSDLLCSYAPTPSCCTRLFCSSFRAKSLRPFHAAISRLEGRGWLWPVSRRARGGSGSGRRSDRARRRAAARADDADLGRSLHLPGNSPRRDRGRDSTNHSRPNSSPNSGTGSAIINRARRADRPRDRVRDWCAASAPRFCAAYRRTLMRCVIADRGVNDRRICAGSWRTTSRVRRTGPDAEAKALW